MLGASAVSAILADDEDEDVACEVSEGEDMALLDAELAEKSEDPEGLAVDGLEHSSDKQPVLQDAPDELGTMGTAFRNLAGRESPSTPSARPASIWEMKSCSCILT